MIDDPKFITSISFFGLHNNVEDEKILKVAYSALKSSSNTRNILSLPDQKLFSINLNIKKNMLPGPLLNFDENTPALHQCRPCQNSSCKSDHAHYYLCKL